MLLAQQVKFGGFNKKPITVGLLKRGLGGMSGLNHDNKMSIGESSTLLASSVKGDMFHGKAKVSKPSTISFSSAEARQKIGKLLYKYKYNSLFL